MLEPATGQGVDQRLLVGEVPVDGTVADTELARDAVEVDGEPVPTLHLLQGSAHDRVGQVAVVVGVPGSQLPAPMFQLVTM